MASALTLVLEGEILARACTIVVDWACSASIMWVLKAAGCLHADIEFLEVLASSALAVAMMPGCVFSSSNSCTVWYFLNSFQKISKTSRKEFSMLSRDFVKMKRESDLSDEFF